ncbi:hypothetical protein PVK64_20315 [Aliivibrio sp. S4TY2]|uniref:hypothetical protein n=1 Tax=unclassified Aliivibrio TaxID=2645654 RepID=UPI00237990B7|nr:MULTISPECIES: hypothetical protein [unclassified Aliivibrio]MDD9158508.1 hypothetical protein [Aliivibrio sp. S4TY2]MDD9162507.1 hypothetical protein [Aliivibrio sp. S4TY1]MDD9166507.1 hypothetical protein [Aliivibrio sp. S4MY2]MDD9170505.1 hypothetical protein [Aliivibrio sp. S4MY4]MDD9186866.1 hypothetical protein [Aliivibrio sp. S4MY3]
MLSKLYRVLLITFLYFIQTTMVNAAATCGPWNDYQNCIDDRPKPPNGVDQGTYSEKRKNEFKSDIIPPFNEYKVQYEKILRNNNLILDNDINNIERIFTTHISLLRTWEYNYPSSFNLYYGNKSVDSVINDEIDLNHDLLIELIRGSVDRAITRYSTLNKTVINSIKFHYWAKAYAPFISGTWGFEPEWSYRDNISYNNYYYTINDSTEDNFDIKEITYSDLWNNAATGPTVKSETRYISLERNEEYIKDVVLSTINKITQNSYVLSDNLNENEFISKIINFDYELISLTSVNFNSQFKEQILKINNSDFIKNKSRFLNINLYKDKNTALLFTLPLIRHLVTNNQDATYREEMKSILLKVKENSWFIELPNDNAYVNLVNSILNDDDINIIVNLSTSDDFLHYQINEIGINITDWGINLKEGDIVPYYRDDEIQLFSSKFNGNASEHNWYFPTDHTSNGKWDYLGIFITKDNYKHYIKKIKSLSEWNSFTLPGDLHYYNGMYFSPRFIGKASDTNYYYPTAEENNRYWIFIGNDTKPSPFFYHYIQYSLKHYANLLQYNNLNINEGINDINQNIRYKLHENLSAFFESNYKTNKYHAFSAIDPSLTLVLHNQYDWIIERLTTWNNWTEENYQHLVDINDGFQPSDAEIIEHWANGQWDAPEEFRQWWLDTSSYFETDSPSEVIRQLNIFEQVEELEEASIELTNGAITSLINSMNITEIVNVATTSTLTLSAILPMFIFL